MQLGQVEGRTLLLTGDVGPVGLNEAADYAQALGLLAPPNFVQVPHHGSRKNVTPADVCSESSLRTRCPQNSPIPSAGPRTRARWLSSLVFDFVIRQQRCVGG